ncbi:sulfoxide reductase heme-binding subunit YedZ [Rhodospirillum rubrum]|uniref:sulfite oxidase heme-binding subunit YedZ n=1 Tax=Rhodospirillum rubrum TaxID=1085 RepID=UPI0019055C0F|nr:protein-methionine-sulfoxide reductase heme-binding subunit MsrQ [Rhodospirillum rubrum]MBK1664426.1 sulfoxide reductase heme-binding subunit YedZ [Rhodospirillum rubrum]MBK1675300.1 sulfoxide reductase heme-binding subunit YedZ [Rhodospirillum rubrum]
MKGGSVLKDRDRLGRIAVFVACLLPLVWYGARFVGGDLGANPIEAFTRKLGEWGLILLLASLAATPARLLWGWTFPLRRRRMVGLFAFFYVCLHLLSYIGLDQFFDWGAIWADIVKRTYITVGMAAVLLLIPLAVTSTRGMVRRLGGKRWIALHRLVYPAAALGVLHYMLMVKADLSEPLIFAGVLGLLLALRLVPAARRRRSGRAPS